MAVSKCSGNGGFRSDCIWLNTPEGMLVTRPKQRPE
jgi:hypothetical protein